MVTVGKVLMLREGERHLAEEIPYTDESELQGYLESHPGLIPLGDLQRRDSKLYLIGREVSVPTGAIDLLFVDDEGVLTVVETKLSRELDSRRAVGQILEYGSHIAEWGVQEVDTAVAAARRRNPPAPRESWQALDERLKQAEFRAAIESNLKAGSLRLIIALDAVPEPLQRTVAFLNATSQSDIVTLVQVPRFRAGDGHEILVPLLVESPLRPPPPPWDLPRFLRDVARRCPDEVVEISRDLYLWAEELAKRGEGYDLNWGRGAVYGSFTFRKLIGAKWATLFTVSSSGSLTLDFGPKQKELFGGGPLETFHRALNQIPGVHLPTDILHPEASKYPTIPLKQLGQAGQLGAFKAAILVLAASQSGRTQG